MVTKEHSTQVRTRKKKGSFNPPFNSKINEPVRESISNAIQDFDDLLSKSQSNFEEEKPLVLDIEAAIRTLETTPHERHVLDEETLEWMKKLFEKIDSEEIDESLPTDASENLDEYIYNPHHKDS